MKTKKYIHIYKNMIHEDSNSLSGEELIQPICDNINNITTEDINSIITDWDNSAEKFYFQDENVEFKQTKDGDWCYCNSSKSPNQFYVDGFETKDKALEAYENEWINNSNF